MKGALIVGGVALGVAAAGVLLLGVDGEPSVTASRLLEQAKALSRSKLPFMEGTAAPEPSRGSQALAGASVVAPGTLARPAFEDDDLVDRPPSADDAPSVDDGELSGRAERPPGAASLETGGPFAASGARDTPPPRVSPVADPPAELRRPNVDGRPAAGATLRPSPVIQQRPAATALVGSPPPVAAPRSGRISPGAPHATGGNPNAGAPAHDDPDSVLPPSPPGD